MDIELTELKREFLEEAEAKVVEIRSRLKEAGETPPEESLKRMIDLAHQLKGAGGSYGYAEISRHAAKLENELEQIGEGSGGSVGSLQPIADELAREISERSASLPDPA